MTIAPDGPFTVHLKILTTNGENIGVVDYSLPPGAVPTVANITEALKAVQESPIVVESGLELMGRHEFVQHLMAEHVGVPGIQFATPGPDEFTIKLGDEA